jgi:SAM-dependent methyltransferase
MFQNIPSAAWNAMACAQCGSKVSRTPDGIRCGACGTRFAASQDGALDLRLRRSRRTTIEFELGSPLLPSGFQFKPLEWSVSRQVDFSGIDTPWHLTPEILSYFPRATSPDSLSLDLGCGSGLHRAVCERAGFSWVGLDYANPAAPMLGDGHALPFQDSSIDFVLSMAVLEHIRYPFVAAKEVFRVLKPGGLYIGTVAFLEPFHGDSYYHHTHLGTYNTLKTAGFIVVCVAPNARWPGLKAQATMGGLFPRLPAAVGSALVWPLDALHRMWWRVGRRFSPNANELARLVTNAGAFEFVARKPE